MASFEERWPHARASRRVPLQAYEGETAASTAALREKAYLDELDRQAAIFNSAFGDAMTAALVSNNTGECWRHLQSSLFAAIIVNRMVDPSKSGQRGWRGVSRTDATKVAQERATRLRELVGLPSPVGSKLPIFLVGNVRNGMEHIDERLDQVLHEGAVGSVSDWYLSDGRLRILQVEDRSGVATPLGLRAFVPAAGLLYFNDQVLHMFLLDLHMLLMRHKIIEARVQLAPRLVGRFTFGAGQMVSVVDTDTVLADLRNWESEREKLIASLPDSDVAR